MRYLLILLSAFSLFISSLNADEQYTLNQYLNIKANYSPHFVPGSDDIIYGNSSTGVYQVWRINLSWGEPQQLTFFDEGVDNFYVHRTENVMLLGVDEGGNERTQLYLADTYGRNLHKISDNDEAIYAFGGFSRDGRYLIYESNERNPTYFDIYLYDIKLEFSEVILKSDDSNFSVGFSPDGRYIAFLRAYDSNNDDLFLIDLENWNRLLHITPHKGDAQYGCPEWLPDSSGFYFSSNEGSEFINLAFYDMSDEEWEWVERPNWDLEDYGVSLDGKYLWWEINEDGYDELKIKDLQSGDMLSTPSMTLGQFNGITISPDSEYLLYGHNSPDRPNDIYRWKLDSYQNPKRITQADLSGIDEDSFVVPILMHYNSFDGLRVPCYLYKPSDLRVGERVPVIVSIHGGPESQAQAWFDAMAQYFLNRDFAFVVPNIRGSSGYGEVYSHLDDRFKRLDSVKDVESLNEWLRRQSWVDNSALIIEGGSYGGYVVLACLTEQPDLWLAGVDSVGISNFITFLENTAPWRRHLRESEYGYLDTDREFLNDISPINKADEITAPLVVIQGANDPRVPQEEAEQIVDACLSNGVPVLYLFYKDEGHGLSKLENRLDAYPKTVSFLELVMEGNLGVFTGEFEKEYLKGWDDKSKDVELIESEFQSISSYIKDGEFGKAELKLSRILALDSKSYSANELMKTLEVEKYTREGISFYQKGELENSLSAFNRVAEINPKSKMIQDYITTLENTIQLKEEEKTKQEKIDDLISKAEVYASRGEYGIAINQYEKVLEIAPDYTTLKSEISLLRTKLKVKEEKVETTKITEDITSVYDEGVKLIDAGRYGDGIRLLEYVYSTAGNYKSTVNKLSVSYFYLGMEAYGNGFYEDAIGYWDRILEKTPNNSEVIRMLERARSELEGLR